MTHKYSVQIEWSEEDKAFIASVPELPGCKADGESAEQALQELDVVIGEWIETAKQAGRKIPQPLTSEQYEQMRLAFKKWLHDHVKREVEQAVGRVLSQLSNKMPALTADPADYWKTLE